MYLVLFTGLIFASQVFASGRLVYMHEEGDAKQILLADENGKNAKAITSGEAWHLYPDIDGSGKHVAYVEGTPETGLNVVTQELATGTVTARTKGHGTRLHPDFSGNGRYLAYTSMPQGGHKSLIEILDLTVKDGEPVKIAGEHSAYFPALSSDGAFLVYQRSKTQDIKNLVRRDLVSGEEKDLTSPEGESMAPSLSFDDRLVVYTSNVGGNWDVYLQDLTTGKVRRLTDHGAKDYAPTFRPDGSVVFASNRRGRFELYEIPVQAMHLEVPPSRLLVQGPGDHYAPSVSGDVDFRQATLPLLPDPARSSFGTARVGNRIYIVGGHQGHEHTYPPESFLDQVAYYDLDTQTWKQTTPRPASAHGYGIATQGKYLYAFGGFAYSADHLPKWKSLDSIDRLDTETGEWTRLTAKLAEPRSSNVVAQLGDKVYLIGGWDSTPKAPKDYEGKFLRTIEVFNLTTETIETSAQVLPDPLRRALTSVVVGEEILLIGGLGQGASHFELLDQVTAYNPATGQWRELPKLPFATFAPAAGFIGDSLFVFGGMFKTGTMNYEYVSHIYGHQLGAAKWRHTGRYLSGSKGFAMVVPLADQTLGILGGHAYEGDTDTPVKVFESFGQ